MHTSDSQTQSQDFVSSFSMQRQRLLHHAGSLLGSDAPKADPTTVAGLTQALMTSLELLKVAEEELRTERRTSATLAAAQDRRLSHMTAMFELAPVALVLTTTDTTIREANRAAATLLGRDVYELAGVQLSQMVPKAQLEAFREQLVLTIKMGTVLAWSFPLELRRTGRATITATVSMIDDAAVGTRALYWTLRTA